MRGNKREKKLFVNLILYFFGSLGKGLASVFIVLIGSFYINPSEMGIYDLVISTIALLQPIIIFQINDGIYRWLLDNTIDSEETIRCGYRIAFRNMMVTNIVMAIVFPFLHFNNKLLIALLVNINCIYPIFQQITRGLKNHKYFAISGILNGIIILGLSNSLLRYTNMGIGGFYLSQIIANAVSVTYLILVQELPVDFWKSPNKDVYSVISKPMQRYSILLVPNSVNQWVMKALDKYCILIYLSTYFNGIYTVAHRFPDVLVMMNNMFYSAWVEQSIVEYNSDDRDVYYSKIFNSYASCLIGIVLIIMPITKYALTLLSGSEYNSAHKYVPFLYIAVVFNGLSSFIGTGYLGTKKTEGIMWTSLLGACINTLINVLLMKKYGLQIAAISSVCAYAVMLFARIVQTKKFFSIKINYFQNGILIGIAFVFAILIQKNKLVFDVVMEVAALIIFVKFNLNLIKEIYTSIIRKITV